MDITRKTILHSHYCKHIRAFSKTLLHIEPVSIEPLYTLARSLDWYNCGEPISLSEFIKRYLTVSEQELFDIIYPSWLIEECETKIRKEWDPDYFQKKNNLCENQ